MCHILLSNYNCSPVLVLGTNSTLSKFPESNLDVNVKPSHTVSIIDLHEPKLRDFSGLRQNFSWIAIEVN